MGGSDNNNHQLSPQQPVGAVYPYAQQPQQQNLYFQPQYVPQMPHAPMYAEQPVLQGSSVYPSTAALNVPHHQPVYVHAVPPQPTAAVYPTAAVEPQPTLEQPTQPSRSCRFNMTKVKQYLAQLDSYRVCSFLSIMSFVAYFLFTPHAVPWFLIVAAFSAAHCGAKYIKETRDAVDEQARLYIHALWYGSLNTMMVLINLWEGRYPWSVFTLCIWGIVFAMHAMKIYNTNTFKSRLYLHFIIYVATAIMILVASSRGRHTPLSAFLVLGVWSIIIAFHAEKVRKDEIRRNNQPEELQVVESSVPQEQNDNAQLVQNQQEVYNSIQQAQQDQRAQQNARVHLFQQPPIRPNF